METIISEASPYSAECVSDALYDATNLTGFFAHVYTKQLPLLFIPVMNF